MTPRLITVSATLLLTAAAANAQTLSPVVVRTISPETRLDPERLYSSDYYVSEKNLAVEYKEIVKTVPTEDPVPERQYQYYTGDDQIPVFQTDAALALRLAGDPETQFEYYSKPAPEMYRELKYELFEVPVFIDPELRFKHYREPFPSSVTIGKH